MAEVDHFLPPGWAVPKSLAVQQLCRPDGSVVNDGNGTRSYSTVKAAVRDAWARSGLGTPARWKRLLALECSATRIVEPETD